ncbi:recombinase A [uncultured Caudovirales phage]|uniref:Recombinase A n=1 Tax=uncultured Caudovirales phage TaxID=2100421 RepID=A0A6J5KXW8_9CAUD|nr:recombinase A [uncultured Caudovirales phage]
MSTLLDRIKSAGTIKQAAILSESPFFNTKDCVRTNLPILNIAFSGSISGGLVPGLSVFAGESKSFKTLLGLYCMKAYFDKYPDAVAMVYDSEFGITPDYLISNGIDTSRVIHIPIEHIEMLKFDIVKRLDEVKRGDRVFIMVDSLGALSSKKEVEDALDEKSVSDMTRAKAIRSLLRIITPHLTMKDIPCIVINHIYKTMELYSKSIVGGGTAVTYSANQIFIISKSQEKEGTDLVGWNFTINIEKSRFVREKSKLPFTVKFDGGISKWSGLLDIALESGHVIKPSNGWYSKVNVETGEVDSTKFRLKDTHNKDFWLPIISNSAFNDYIKQHYQISNGSLLTDESIEEELALIEEDLGEDDE